MIYSWKLYSKFADDLQTFTSLLKTATKLSDAGVCILNWWLTTKKHYYMERICSIFRLIKIIIIISNNIGDAYVSKKYQRDLGK